MRFAFLHHASLSFFPIFMEYNMKVSGKTLTLSFLFPSSGVSMPQYLGRARTAPPPSTFSFSPRGQATDGTMLWSPPSFFFPLFSLSLQAPKSGGSVRRSLPPPHPCKVSSLFPPAFRRMANVEDSFFSSSRSAVSMQVKLFSATRLSSSLFSVNS